ncbi:hypothetical protein ES703_105380 [subsurface metagenome]
MTYRNDNLLFGDKVLDVELLDLTCNFCSPFVAVLFLYFVDIFANDIEQGLLAGQYCFVTLNLLGEVGIFFRELFYLQPCQSLQLHR